MAFNIKQGDLLPSIQATCTDADGAVDITAATGVRFYLRPLGGSDADEPLVAADASVVDAANGVVRYDWAEGDTDVAGYFRAEFEVTSGGKPLTFPNDSDTIVHIRKQVG